MVLSQFTSEDGKLTLASLGDFPRDVYPVGRLDYDSEGLLLITNDNYLKNKVLDPKFEHGRAYLIQVDGAITDQAIAELRKGPEINVNGKIYKTKPCKADLLIPEPNVPARTPPIRVRKEIPAPWIRLELREGKNRQARKMTAKVGFPTLRLIRESIENFQLKEFTPGYVQELTKNEIYSGLGIR